MRLLGFGLAAGALAAATLHGGQNVADTRAASEAAYRANNSGVAALERFDYTGAAPLFREAVRLDPSIGLAQLNLAIALHYAGQSDAALAQSQAAAKTMPREARAWFVMGLAARAATNDAIAFEAFARVLELDPDDAASLINLGQLQIEAGRFAEAIENFRKAMLLEPFNATGAYGLGTALVRARRPEEGKAALARFQALRDAPGSITYGNGYLQQGRYGEALVSVGAEPQLVDRATPATTFTEMTSEIMAGTTAADVRWAALVDLDQQGPLELLLGGDAAVRIVRRDGNSWLAGVSLATAGSVGAAVADFDNDNLVDVCVLGTTGVTLWRQVERGRFEDVTAPAQLSQAFGGRAGAWGDLDHDGDADLVLSGIGVGQVWRNNGNGTFTPFPVSSGLRVEAGISSLVAIDFDARRDLDLVGAGPGGSVLLKNMREGRFENVAASAGLPSGAFTALAVADINLDGRADLFFARADGAGTFALSRGMSGFVTAPGPEPGITRAAMFVDYDADGLTDLVTYGEAGLQVHRSVGDAWIDVSAAARIVSEPCAASCALGAGDLDADGDIDMVTTAQGRIRIWRNNGPSGFAVALGLSPRVSNRAAIGAKIEIRAGSLLRRSETVSAWPPVTPTGSVFGLGTRRADVVRVIWPSGIVQSEAVSSASGGLQRTNITELDRKPSSCPMLFAWNGERFEFVTDFLGGGETGAWQFNGQPGVPDPEEFVRIRGDQLRERDGRYELRVTNELEEVLYLDRLSLIAVTHPAGSDVYPNEGLFSDPYPSHRLFVSRGAAPPTRVVDEHGHDSRALVSHRDRSAPSDFALERFRGYAADHYLEFDVAARQDPNLLLLLTAWTDYAFSSDNLAASHAGLSLRPPSLERLQDGQWRTIVENVGIPVGRPQTVVVDLSRQLPLEKSRLRLRTNMRIYWDQLLLDTSSGGGVRRTPIDLDRAQLRWRGYSAEVSPDGREPFSYDYARVSANADWKLMPGRYTREGDVTALLTAVDDRFVVARPGDEIALTFPAPPPPPAGWMQTFLLHADGFSKEMDVNSASPDVAAPLPFHGMRSYPADSQRRRLSAALRDYIDHYNTRVISRSVPLLLGRDLQ